MPILERGKKLLENITGWQRPSSDDLDRVVHSRKANKFLLKDDGVIPNHPHWPLIVYPAGIGHQCLEASHDFLVVGAYPPDGTYDECTSSEDHARAVETIPRVRKPREDPVYGGDGPALDLWKASH